MGGVAPGFAVRVFSRSGRRVEGAVSTGAHQGVHDGGGCVSGEARQAVDPGGAGEDEGRRGSIAVPAVERRFLRTGCGTSFAITRSTAGEVAGDGKDGAQGGPAVKRDDAVTATCENEEDPHRPHGEARVRCRMKTGGFQTFIPLAFHPQHTALGHPGRRRRGFDDMRQIAIGRLMLGQTLRM